MNPVPSVIFSEQVTPGGQRIATALLNSERTLNALTLDMIRLLAERLTRWQHDPDIALIVLALIVISGKGKRSVVSVAGETRIKQG